MPCTDTEVITCTHTMVSSSCMYLDRVVQGSQWVTGGGTRHWTVSGRHYHKLSSELADPCAHACAHLPICLRTRLPACMVKHLPEVLLNTVWVCSLSMGGGGQRGHSGLPSSLGTPACMCTTASVPGQRASWKVSLQAHWGFTVGLHWAGMLNSRCRPMQKWDDD